MSYYTAEFMVTAVGETDNPRGGLIFTVQRSATEATGQVTINPAKVLHVGMPDAMDDIGKTATRYLVIEMEKGNYLFTFNTTTQRNRVWDHFKRHPKNVPLEDTKKKRRQVKQFALDSDDNIFVLMSNGQLYRRSLEIPTAWEEIILPGEDV